MLLGGGNRRFAEDFLVIGIEELPRCLTEREDVGNHGVLGVGKDLRDLAVRGVGQGGLIRFGAVHETRLEARVDFAERQDERCAAELADEFGLGTEVLHADLEAAQVVWRFDRLVDRVKRPRTRGVVGERAKAVLRARIEEGAHVTRIHRAIVVLLVVEEERQAKGVVAGGVRGDRRCRAAHDVDDTAAQLFDRLGLASEYAVAEHLDADVSVRAFIDLVDENFEGLRGGVFVAQRVGHAQFDLAVLRELSG